MANAGASAAAERRRLALHHLCATEVSPAELAAIAARLAIPDVSLFVRAPSRRLDIFPTVRTMAEARELRARLDGLGRGVHNIEVFSLTPRCEVSAFSADLERGATLGARRATVHVQDGDPVRAGENFAAACALARGFGISVGIEFMSFSALTTYKQAVEFVARSGEADACVVVDALHLHRGGGKPSDIDPSGAALVGSLQICDGPREAPAEPFEEAVAERVLPGRGAFALAELVAALPPDIPVDLEVPLGALRANGVAALDRVRLIRDATRRLLGAA